MSEVIHELIQDLDRSLYEPPAIALGQFERVGSTFYLDQLEKSHIVHNKPYKLLLPGQWPIARNFPRQLQSIDDFFRNGDIQEADKHWFRNFVLSLHAPGNQVVKETCLFFALPQFLECFPGSNISILSRSPMGIASSFKRNGLFERWGYANLASTLNTQLNATRPDNYGAMRQMIAERGTWREQLAWMIGLNAVLLSRHIPQDHIVEIVRYEEDIVPEGQKRVVYEERSSDSIFSTNINKTHDDFENRFTQPEIDELILAMEACSKFVKEEFDLYDQRLFAQLYSRHIADRRVSEMHEDSPKIGKVSHATEATDLILIQPDLKPIEHDMKVLDDSQEIAWDNSLITNLQMASFLQELIEAGLDPAVNHMFLLDNMPISRGGRINFDKQRNSFALAKGFENYPAYWVSWLANSLFAYREGMRLPTYDEWSQIYKRMDPGATTGVSNHSYMYDDATPTGDKSEGIPIDFFGNLRIWCSDWSDQIAVSKKIAGISWKNEYYDGYAPENQRPYLTNSRVIGARLVTNKHDLSPERKSIEDVLVIINEIMEFITSTVVTTVSELSELNRIISDKVSITASE